MANKSLGLTKFSGVVRPATAELPPQDIVIKPQVRSKLGDLSELKASISANGIQIRLIVSVEPDGTKELVAGERRLRSALELGLPLVPVELKYDLTKRQKRKLQVTENRDRTDLSPFDEVMGIVRDVEEFGVEEALEIWGNKSRAWLSKRLTAAKLPAELMHLLENDLVVDVELLGMLSQLRKKDLDRYSGLMKRVRSGKSVTREDVRLALDRAKEDLTRQEDTGGEETQPPVEAENFATEPSVSPKGQSASNPGGGQATSKIEVAPRPRQSVTSAEASGAASAEVDRLRGQICTVGRTIGQTMKKLEAAMESAGLAEEDQDFIRWVALVDAAIPMLSAGGKSNARALLSQLQRSFAKREVLDVWEELHGTEGDFRSVPRRPDGMED